jgi:hypothetical protein
VIVCHLIRPHRDDEAQEVELRKGGREPGIVPRLSPAPVRHMAKSRAIARLLSFLAL